MPSFCRPSWCLLVVAIGCDGGATMRASDIDAAAGSDADPAGMLPCSALKPLADRPVLGPWQSHFPYFSPDRSWLLLQVRGEPDRLLRVELPSGNVTTVADTVREVQPLAPGGPFLLFGTGSSGHETAVYDGKDVRQVWSDGVCNFQPSPDGTRLFVIGACVGDENGLVAIDVVTGSVRTVDPRATRSTTWNLAVSPHGHWAAYTTGDSDLDNRTITVASVAGDAYTIASVRGVMMLQFISDDLLVFHTGGKADHHGDIRGHLPGSGDTSFLIASDLWHGPSDPYYGYKLSPDRTQVLAAKLPAVRDTVPQAELYSVPLHGGEPRLLVRDWVLPSSYFTSPFYFDSQGKYVIYLSPRDGDAASFTTWVVDMQGSPPRKLVDGSAGPTPATSSVLIDDSTADGRYRLRLTDIATLRDRLSYTSKNQIISAAVIREDQAILFADYDEATLRARFMSVRHPQAVLLGGWQESSCRGCSAMMPVQPDPTGCFTVLNTDSATSPGTRLVLLPE